MSTVEVEAIVTTTHPVPAYGGVQLADSVLYEMAEAIRSGAVPMLQSHDLRRPLDVAVIDAQVRDRSDGYKELWVLFTVDAAQWAAFEAERDQAGAPGGFSFSGSTPIGSFESRDERSGLSLSLDADAAHWTEEEIRSAAEPLRSVGRVDAAFRFQFAADPMAVVALGVAGTIAIGIITNAIYDALKCFLRPRRPTTFHFHLVDGDRSVTAYLETDDGEVLRRALETFEGAAKPSKLLVWNAEKAEWEVR